MMNRYDYLAEKAKQEDLLKHIKEELYAVEDAWNAALDKYEAYSKEEYNAHAEAIEAELNSLEGKRSDLTEAEEALEYNIEYLQKISDNQWFLEDLGLI